MTWKSNSRRKVKESHHRRVLMSVCRGNSTPQWRRTIVVTQRQAVCRGNSTPQWRRTIVVTQRQAEEHHCGRSTLPRRRTIVVDRPHSGGEPSWSIDPTVEEDHRGRSTLRRRTMKTNTQHRRGGTQMTLVNDISGWRSEVVVVAQIIMVRTE